VAVAELAFGLMIALDRRIADNVADLQRGKWNKKEYSKARGLAGSTIGLLGFGKIGQEMAKRAMAFHMNLVIWSELGVRQDKDAIPVDLPLMLEMRRGADASGLIQERISVVNSPAEVAERCDVLSIHLAAGPLTKKIVNADVIARLKPGAYVINTARADVLDYDALAKAVVEKGIRVGLDVYPGEPATGNADFAHPILGLPGVYGTHHVGASTDQAQEAIALETVRIVSEFKATGRVPNVVNLAKKTPATHTIIVRHKDQPGVLACMFAKLAGAGINAHETENIVFEAAEAAIARVNVDREPSAALLESFRHDCPAVYEVNVVTLGAEVAAS
jgi:D-3-phosphoglycerate dehydrogenase